MRRSVRKPQIRLITALLAAAVVFSSCPAAAQAEEAETIAAETETITAETETFPAETETFPAETETVDPALPAEIAEEPEDLAIPAEILDAAAEELAEAAPDEAPFLLRRLSVFLPEGALTDTFGAASAMYYPEAEEYVLDYDSPEAAAEACDLLCAAYGEDRVLPDLLITAAAEPYTETEALSNSWGSDRMQTDLARDLANADPELTGSVLVAVLDGGIYADHEMLAGRMSADGANYIDDEEMTEGSGHGTHVAGIIADGTPDCVTILPVKILDQKGNGSFTNMIRGVQYAVERGADVINMSFGVNLASYSQATIDKYMPRANAALQAAAEAGCVCIGATGNNGGNTEELISFPAVSDYALSVGSVDQSLERASTSNYGAAVDFAAPGVSILSAGNDVQSYVTKSGTSMASPHIAAACALIRLYNPGLPPALVERLLRESCTDLGDPGRDDYYGWGMPVFADGAVPVRSIVFTDVTDPAAFYFDPVYWAADCGITTGWAESDGTYTFRPWSKCTRAAIVTFLWRAAGSPEPEETDEAPFTDMTGNEDFDSAMLWASQQEITTGWAEADGTHTFRPWAFCNRAAIVTFLWRAAGRPEPEESEEEPFTDMTGNEDFDSAMLWASQQGIATGWEEEDGTSTFRPWETCNRAAVAAFLYRYAQSAAAAEP